MRSNRPHIGLASGVFPESPARAFDRATTSASEPSMRALGFGTCPFPPFPTSACATQRSLEETLLCWFDRHGAHQHGADRHGADRHGADRHGAARTNVASVVVAPGCKGLVFALLHTWPGPVVVAVPTWTAALEHLRTINKFVSLATHNGEGLPDANDIALALQNLQDAGQTAQPLLLLNYPNSPTGLTYSDAELQAIATVATRHNAVVLADEIHSETLHRGQFHSIEKFYPKTLRLTGLSKWTGWLEHRFGALRIPQQVKELRALQEPLEQMIRHTLGTLTDYSRHVARDAFSMHEAVTEQLLQQNRICGAMGKYASRTLTRAGLLCAQPSAGFYVYPNLRSLMTQGDEASLLAKLYDARIACVPGTAFGDDGYRVRLALVDFDGTEAVRAVRLVPIEQPVSETFLRVYCASVMNAIDTLVALAKS